MFVRQITAECASVNMATGEFNAVLATDGDATDGHVLSIPGASMAPQVPFFVNHERDPRTQIGSLFDAGRDEHRLHVRAQVMLDGEGAQAEIRRDLLQKIAAGHARQMSAAWDQVDWVGTRRTQLPPSHPAHVTERMARSNPRLARGIHFDRFRITEGSLVGIGADKAALARFANDPNASEVIRAFWRAAAEPPQSVLDELLERCTALEDTVAELAEEKPAQAGQVSVEPPPRRSFAEELAARAESLASDFGAYLQWRKGAVLRGPALAAATRMRTRLDAIRANERRSRRGWPPAA